MNKRGYGKTAVTAVALVTPLIKWGFFCNQSVTARKSTVTQCCSVNEPVPAVTVRNRCKSGRLHTEVTPKNAYFPGYRACSGFFVTAVTAVTAKKYVTQKAKRICTSKMREA